MTSTSNAVTSVPRTTDRPVQRIPAWTSESGMIGSPAEAAAAGQRRAAAVATARRMRIGGAA
jgi:hypothetical protein